MNAPAPTGSKPKVPGRPDAPESSISRLATIGYCIGFIAVLVIGFTGLFLLVIQLPHGG